MALASSFTLILFDAPVMYKTNATGVLSGFGLSCEATIPGRHARTGRDICCVVRDRVLYVCALSNGEVHVVNGDTGVWVTKIEFPTVFFSVGRCCATPRGTILVSEDAAGRVQEIDVFAPTATATVRYVGNGMLVKPQALDCNNDVIVVAEFRLRISVFGWSDGARRALFSSNFAVPPEPFSFLALCLTRDDTIVVTKPDHLEASGCRSFILDLHGALVHNVPRVPFVSSLCRLSNLGVLLFTECLPPTIVAASTPLFEKCGTLACWDPLDFMCPIRSVAVANNDTDCPILVTRDNDNRLKVFRYYGLRMAWLSATCVWRT